MGFFNKGRQDEQPEGAPMPVFPSSSGGLEPLSKARIKAAIESKSWKYRVDEDGDISASWDPGFFWFFTQGEKSEILLVRGTWFGKLPVERRLEAVEACNDWNRDKLWPKVYTRVDDAGEVRLHCEHIVDYEYGVSDDQLVQHLITVIQTGCSFFERLNELFPEAAPKEE